MYGGGSKRKIEGQREREEEREKEKGERDGKLPLQKKREALVGRGRLGVAKIISEGTRY